MKIISVTFDYAGCTKYDLLAKVLEYSIKKNCPSADFELVKLAPPKPITPKKCFASNTLKLEVWLQKLKETKDNVVFLDCDMILVKDISDAFNYDFDIGIMKRNLKSIPFNGGVVFVRNNPAGIAFIELWNNINKKMYNNFGFHQIWRAKYAGMNQAALGYILEKEKFQAKVKQFPCAEWDSCRENWSTVNDNTRIIHIKSELRRAVLNEKGAVFYYAKYLKAITMWNQLAKEANINIANRYPVQVKNANQNMIKTKMKRRRWFEKTLGRNYATIARKSKSRRR